MTKLGLVFLATLVAVVVSDKTQRRSPGDQAPGDCTMDQMMNCAEEVEGKGFN
jgi:hypothetical protein